MKRTDMINMNTTTVLLSLFGSCAYVCSMSLLGRWLGACREHSSVPFPTP